MSQLSLARRWALRAGTAVVAATALAAGLQFSAGATLVSGPHPNSGTLSARMWSRSDPYAPTFRHPYRHGVIPTVRQFAQMRIWALRHPNAAPALSLSDLSYGGAVDSIGVTDGPPKVYLVFWGSQWGSQSPNSNGNLTFSNDPNGAAPYLQKLFKGLGTGGELWSAVMTQYCEGVATGTQTCPSSNT